MRYKNFDGSVMTKRFDEFFRWKVLGETDRGVTRAPPGYCTPTQPALMTRILEAGPHATWVGHATFLLRLGDQLIATDPLFSRWIGPFRRLVPAGLPKEALPAISLVTVSHAHPDHLDFRSLRRIGNSATYVTPVGNGALLRRLGLTRVRELAWWESTTVGDVRITLVPAQHWSMRAPWDRNRRLWGGFIYESQEGVAYHAGDTAFSQPMFEAIHERFPTIDWAMMPIGAYSPEWFMAAQHVNPEDAGRAFQMLEAKYFCAMHWGTLKLSDEPQDEPPRRIRAWFERAGYPSERLLVFDVGETKSLARS